MATISDLLRTLSRYQDEILYIQRCADDLMAVKRRADEIQPMQRVIAERNRRFAEACVKLQWPPPWHLPTTAIDRIVKAYDSGRLSARETSDVFASYYTGDRIAEFGARWETYPWLSARMPILREALANHIEGRHHSAVCVLMPQIEGVLREELGEKPKQANSVTVMRGSQLGDAAGVFFADVIWENFNPDAGAPIPELSRHAILHGKALDYGTPLHSLKVILIADIILSSIDENRRRPADEAPEADI
jgi:hypothetical protein